MKNNLQLKKLIPLLAIMISCFYCHFTFANNIRVEPPFWYAGMNNPNLQLIVHADQVGLTTPEIDYKGVKITTVNKIENVNYLIIDLQLDKNVKPGSFIIKFIENGKSKYSYSYELKIRKQDSAERKGFDAGDAIYLLMPDRFSNGDPKNDSQPDMLEKADRTNPSGRHGGDIKGILNHLDYIKALGATAIWINPLLENNNKSYTYHGYAITDFYKIDPRFGSNSDYVNLVSSAHSKGLKIIMDMVFNHCGINHWFINDLPSKDWVNQHKEFTRSNFRAETISDPHSSEYDQNLMLSGWFDNNMPDLNQQNPFVRNYLIQNSIWWIEYAGLDGIRMDTQPYSFKEMMPEWTMRINEEYPDFKIVGEAWMQKESMTAYWQKESFISNGYNSGVDYITDFPLYNAISKSFTEPEGWSEGMARIYYVLAQDFLYKNPYNLLIFADNHDLNRFFTSINKDIDAYKLAMTFLLTTRGIPMIYYGTEFLMEGEEAKGHGFIRKDFPGGWQGDSLNYFNGQGFSDKQKEAFTFIQNILKWRITNEAVKSGKLTQYVPQEGVYVYFRESGQSRIMVILNNSNETRAIETSRFKENLRGTIHGKNIVNGNPFTFRNTILLEPRQPLIIELYN